MNIIYLGSFRLPNYDAAASRVLNIARALREGGHQVTFISWGGQYRQEDKVSEKEFCIDGFRYIITNELDTIGGIISKLKERLTRGKKTKLLLTHWPQKIDAVITYNGSLTRWLLSFCHRNGIRLINDMTEWYSYYELKPMEWIPYAYNMFVTQKRVENKIVISHFLDHYYKMSHNIVVPATCDASEKKWHENIEYDKHVVGEFNGVTLIYAGNPARKDQVHYVVNAVHRLAEEGASIRFLILGTTRESYLSRYASKLHNSKLHKNILFLDRVSQDVIPSFYHQADFMVLLREQTRKSNAGFPTKFTESFTSGTPVIANITSDLGKYLKDGETGFVVSSPNEDAVYYTLKEKILKLNREDIETMKQSVRAASKQLDYHSFVEPLSTFFNELV